MTIAVFFQAEISTNMGVAILIGAIFKDKNILIISDSQVTIKALSSLTIKFRKMLDCRRSLQAMAKQNRLPLKWVPGHRNIEGNCKKCKATCKLLLKRFAYEQR